MKINDEYLPEVYCNIRRDSEGSLTIGSERYSIDLLYEVEEGLVKRITDLAMHHGREALTKTGVPPYRIELHKKGDSTRIIVCSSRSDI